jgi:hypothetical protein
VYSDGTDSTDIDSVMITAWLAFKELFVCESLRLISDRKKLSSAGLKPAQSKRNRF